MSKKNPAKKQRKRRKEEARRKAWMEKRLARSVIVPNTATPEVKGLNMLTKKPHEQADTLVKGTPNEHRKSTAGEPAWDNMLTCWIADFRKSQRGQYLIMCLAMRVDAANYVYAPIVGYSDKVSDVSELFARAGERLAASLHKLPNMVFAAIAKRSDSIDEMKGVFLAPMSQILQAAVHGEPLPGVEHNGVTFLITASPNLDAAEVTQLGTLCDSVTLVPNARQGGPHAATT